jgi:hypothetical protein
MGPIGCAETSVSNYQSTVHGTLREPTPLTPLRKPEFTGNIDNSVEYVVEVVMF